MNGEGSSNAQLFVESGPQGGTRFFIDRPLVTVGRATDNDIVLNDEMVSKHHARVIIQGNNFIIEDLGSSNGTTVNGREVRSHILSSGDRLLLGQTSLTFKSVASAPVTQPMEPGAPVPAPPVPTAAAVAPPPPVAPAPGAAPAPGVAPAPPQAPAARKGGKGVWIVAAVVLILLIAAGVTVALVLLLGGEKDEIKPVVKITSPSSSTQVQLGLPVGTPQEVEIEVTASDNKGLDKIEILVNGKVDETLKATKATKEVDTGGALKEEDFSYKWSVATNGSHTLTVKAYDWKGNVGESDPVSVNVVDGPEIAEAHTYCQSIDELISEYVQYRSKFNSAYSRAKDRKISFAEAGVIFDQVGDERRSLRARLAALTPPAAFAQAQSLFDQQIGHSVEADNYAIRWAADMQLNYPYYQAGQIPDPDPNDYEGKMLSASSSAQKAARSFKEAYNTARASQLKIGPGPDPTQ